MAKEHNFSPDCRTYGICNEYEGKTKVIYREEIQKIQQICTAVASSTSSADNGRRSFAATSYCTGHRSRDDNRKPQKKLQSFEGIAYTNNINTLRNIINDEIEDRRKNAYYNGIEDRYLEQVKDTPIISTLKREGEYIETLYPNAIADKIKYLKSFCDNIKTRTDDSKNLESSIGTISNISSKINSGKIVFGESPKKIQDVIAKAVTDCICYSDCHGFSVCACYGYCNCNY